MSTRAPWLGRSLAAVMIPFTLTAAGQATEPAEQATTQPTTQKAPPALFAKIPAFPGAEGFGAMSFGGRGGKVLYVANLDDSGPGSLREACNTKGPRLVLFKVSGNIELKSGLQIREPYITIAGQTAPGDGITLKNYELYVRTQNAVVRYLRVRPGDVAEGERDAITVRNVDQVIVDHCSASWGIDELCSTTGSRNVTVQWTIISEALHNSHHHKGNHGFGSLIQCEGATYHHNLYAHNRSRNPRPASGLIDFRNNVVYDWDAMAGYAEGNKQRLNFVANYYKPGPSTKTNRDKAFHTGKEETFAYFAKNVLEGVVKEGDPSDLPMINVRNGGNVMDKPFDVPPVAMTSATEAFEAVLKTAGASLARDAVDTRVVQTVRDGTGKQIDSQTDVGGWPELKSAPAPQDMDGDGIPDAVEVAMSLDPKNPADGNADRNGDGYTNVEEYINGLCK